MICRAPPVRTAVIGRAIAQQDHRPLIKGAAAARRDQLPPLCLEPLKMGALIRDTTGSTDWAPPSKAVAGDPGRG